MQGVCAAWAPEREESKMVLQLSRVSNQDFQMRMNWCNQELRGRHILSTSFGDLLSIGEENILTNGMLTSGISEDHIQITNSILVRLSNHFLGTFKTYQKSPSYTYESPELRISWDISSFNSKKEFCTNLNSYNMGQHLIKTHFLIISQFLFLY